MPTSGAVARQAARFLQSQTAHPAQWPIPPPDTTMALSCKNFSGQAIRNLNVSDSRHLSHKKNFNK
jgi:hypothetical protein